MRGYALYLSYLSVCSVARGLRVFNEKRTHIYYGCEAPKLRQTGVRCDRSLGSAPGIRTKEGEEQVHLKEEVPTVPDSVARECSPKKHPGELLLFSVFRCFKFETQLVGLRRLQRAPPDTPHEGKKLGEREQTG